MTLVRLSLRRGEALAESRQIEGSGEVYFCAKDRCPHYQGQLGLLPEAATMHCALVHYPPDRTCQPFYLEAAEHLDQARRQTWEERLAEAEAYERTVASAWSFSPLPSPPSPGRGECVWERGPGGEGPGEAGSSATTSTVAPAASAVATILPFLPPSPAPRGRAGEGAPTQRRTTR